MTTRVRDILDEQNALADARMPWEAYWREIARYVLPQTNTYDMMLGRSSSAAINAVVNVPVAARRSKDLYDMTSLWAIERLTAGMLSLKTPESQNWHDLTTDSYFGEEPTHEEKVALERIRNYLFKVRANPHSGFWPAHKSAIRSMCAFGDGWLYTEEVPGRDARLPYTYQHMPLPELFPGVNAQGQPDRMHRVFRRTAYQLAQKFGYEKLSDPVQKIYDNPTTRHDLVRVLHAVRPRPEDDKKGQLGIRASKWESVYILPEDEHEIGGKGGFWEFPFSRYAWNNTGNSAFSEGPVACAIGEIKSLQEMAKNELIAVQTAVRPAYGTAGKNYMKLNLNPGATNPNMVNPEGRPLFAPLNTGVRPDFAQTVIEARRNSVRELLYLNLWQIIIQDKNETATEALIKAQEKGELLGPVGISLNEGMSHQVDREIAILGRKGAFEDDSPLAVPDSMSGKDVAPRFTSPLDRLRRVSELVGMQRLVEFAMLLAGGDPNQGAKIMARFDIDEMLEQAQEILGAPVKALTSREDADGSRQQANQMQQLMAALQVAQQGGNAAQAIGDGSAAMAQGATVANNSPDLVNTMRDGPGAVADATKAAMRGQQIGTPA